MGFAKPPLPHVFTVPPNVCRFLKVCRKLYDSAFVNLLRMFLTLLPRKISLLHFFSKVAVIEEVDR